MKVIFILIMITFCFSLTGCSTISEARSDLNNNPENLDRGDPENTGRVREYLLKVLEAPENYDVKAFNRRPFSPDNNKGLFMIHYYYVYYNKGTMEHTIVFTDTPKGSEQKGSWMLDAASDVESYISYIASVNAWMVEEYHGPKGQTKLNLVQTTQNILDRIDKSYKFFGGAIVRKLPWYHQVWMFMVPPPVLAYGPLLLMSIHKDNCASAVLDTVAWEKN